MISTCVLNAGVAVGGGKMYSTRERVVLDRDVKISAVCRRRNYR